MKKNLQKKLAEFKKAVWSHYRTHGRHDMAWRRDTSLYAVIVSEIMLQQTQVARVTVKFASWMKRFPTWKALAAAPIADVLQEWSGLGYNRRALYLKRIAESIVREGYNIYVITPDDTADTGTGASVPASTQLYERLRELPGIGPNTAGAILAYTYNIPYPFIETNIRSAYIHFFFGAKAGRPAAKKISDAELMPLIEAALADPEIAAHPREWHWALMDYGSHLKGITPNPSRASAHHVKQSAFKGSNRELRSKILKAAMNGRAFTGARAGSYPAKQIRTNIAALIKEGFLVKKGGSYRIS